MSFVLTESLARRIEQSEIDALESRLKAVKDIDGNPMDVEIKRFGSATAFSVKNIPGPSFNTVKGISEDDMEHIDSILDFYNNRQIPARFEITPAHSSTKLLKFLSDKGYFQCGFHTTLCGTLSNKLILNSTDASVSIRELKQNEFDVFGNIYTKGFNMPSFLNEHIAQNNKVLHNNKHWTFYIASVKGVPAGVGVLFEYDGIGTLAASATIPELRCAQFINIKEASSSETTQLSFDCRTGCVWKCQSKKYGKGRNEDCLYESNLDAGLRFTLYH